MKIPLITVQIRYEHDVVLCRQRARDVARLLEFEAQDQVRIATTISELARNVFQYAKEGKIEFFFDSDRRALEMVVSDRGPGIRDLKRVLSGSYVSATGMGLGLVGAKRLMDSFHVETSEKGTIVTLTKIRKKTLLLPQKKLNELISKLASPIQDDPFLEMQRQNQELLQTMEELQRKQVELAQLNHELEDTNRGVVALYAELDEKADYLRRASDIKSRFLSNMTHEFRTPLNSILALTRMLLDRTDGELSTEQEKQISFIRRAATDLSELVNDLLDLSKVEAGKIDIHPGDFELKDLFGALRGMLRPLLSHNSSINLVFEETSGIPALHTDESKVSQILRNFISNAIKFTESGEVRVSAVLLPDQTLRISVKDSGIGIAPEDQARIFEEFTQVPGPHQHKMKGTGLGLPLSKKLAELLGGSVEVESQPGNGSTFSVILPMSYSGRDESFYVSNVLKRIDPSRVPVLVLDDNLETLFIYESYFKESPFQALPARSLREAREILRRASPAAVILDILLEHESTWSFLSELRIDPRTKDIPVLVVTVVENSVKAMKLGASGFHLKPVEKEWLLENLSSALSRKPGSKLLVVDDDPVARYLLRGLLQPMPYQVIEAAGGHDGLRLAREEQPAYIFLDLTMPDLDGFAVLDRLKQENATRQIPVIIYTSKILTPEETRELEPSIAGVLSKDLTSREESLAAVAALIEHPRLES